MIEKILEAIGHEGFDMDNKFTVIVNQCHPILLRAFEDHLNVSILRAQLSRTKNCGEILFYPLIESFITP